MVSEFIHTIKAKVKRLVGLQSQLSPPVPYRYTKHDARNIYDIVLSGHLTHTTSNEIQLLENEFSDFTETTYALATNSGTSALYLACKSLGLGSGDEVIVPAYTFIASAQAVLLCGATPIFADIDGTFTISPVSITRHITKKTKAIMVVHMFGNVCHMDEILGIAKKHKLKVIEDCAQAIGARYKGKAAGSLGDTGCFSFNEKKATPTGQGGMLITSNDRLFHAAKIIRNTGIEYEESKPDVVGIGSTLHMTSMEASLARSVLRQLEYLNKRRRQNYAYLRKLLDPVKGCFRLYDVVSDSEPSFSRIAGVINTHRVGISSDRFIQLLNERGIPAKTFYPTPLYRYSLFQTRTEKYTHTSLSLPAYRTLPFVEKFCHEQVAFEFSPYWTFRDMRFIASSIKNVINTHVS